MALPALLGGGSRSNSRRSAMTVRPKSTMIPAYRSLSPVAPGKSTKSESNILVEIYSKVVKIDGVLKGTLAEEKARSRAKLMDLEEQKRQKQEDRLEKKKTKEEKKEGGGLQLPQLSFFDRIKQFISSIITGFILQKLVDFAPQLEMIGNIIGSGIEIVADLIIGVVDAAGTFLKWGQDAYDATEGFLKDNFGEGAAETFEGVMSNLNKTFNLIAILGMTVAATSSKLKSDAFSGKPGGLPKGIKPGAVRRYAQRFGRDAAIKKFGKDAVKKFGGSAGRSTAAKLSRNAAVKLFGKGGTKAGLKILKNFISPIVKRIPIIGGLIDFALNYFVFKEPIGRAAFAAIGATIFGALGATAGSILPVGGNIVGGALGGLAGDLAGKWLYDTFFDKKKPVEIEEIDKPITDPAATGGGQPTSNGAFNIKSSNNIVTIGKDLINKGFSVAEHPDFTKNPTASGGSYTPGKGTVSDVHSGRGHYEGRAIDVTDWRGTLEDSKARYRSVLDSIYNNGDMGNKLLIHDSWGIADQTGKNGPGAHGHPEHMHIEVRDKGGVIGKGLFANLGSPEFVLDSDSFMAIESKLPGFLGALNKADGEEALKILANYASYEQGGVQTVIVNRNQIIGDMSRSKDKSRAPIMIPVASESDPTAGLYAMS